MKDEEFCEKICTLEGDSCNHCPYSLEKVDTKRNKNNFTEIEPDEKKEEQTKEPTQKTTEKYNIWAICAIIVVWFSWVIGLGLGVAGLVSSKKLNGVGKNLSIVAIVLAIVTQIILNIMKNLN